jgi:hypothetical protein
MQLDFCSVLHAVFSAAVLCFVFVLMPPTSVQARLPHSLKMRPPFACVRDIWSTYGCASTARLAFGHLHGYMSYPLEEGLEEGLVSCVRGVVVGLGVC